MAYSALKSWIVLRWLWKKNLIFLLNLAKCQNFVFVKMNQIFTDTYMQQWVSKCYSVKIAHVKFI